MKRLFLSAAALLTVLGTPESTDACSIAVSQTVFEIPGCVGSCTETVPRNVVFFANAVSLDGTYIATTRVGDEAFSALADLAPEGATLTVGAVSAVVGAAVDTTAPTMPVVQSARQDTGNHAALRSCGPTCDVMTFSLELTPSMDETASLQLLTYELYFGNSEAEAADELTAPRVRASALGASPESATVVVPEAFGAYVAVAALDQAGNRSARSVPHRVTR